MYNDLQKTALALDFQKGFVMNFEQELNRAKKAIDAENYKHCASTCRIILEAGLREILRDLSVKLKPDELSTAFAKYKPSDNPFARPGIGTMIGFYARTGILERHTPQLRIEDFNRINEIARAGSHSTETVSESDAWKIWIFTKDFLNSTGFMARRKFSNEEAYSLLFEMAANISPLPASLNSYLKKKAIELGINRESEERLWEKLAANRAPVPESTYNQITAMVIQSPGIQENKAGYSAASKLDKKELKTLRLMGALHAQGRLPMHYSEIMTAYEQTYQESSEGINDKLEDGANPKYASAGKVVYEKPRRGFYSLNAEFT